MKYLISVAFALAIATPAMGATEVVIPEKVLIYCEALRGQLGSCDIRPDEHLVIVTKIEAGMEIWDLCPRAKDFDPRWRMETMNEAHTRVFRCPVY